MKSFFTLLATLFISAISFALPYPGQTMLTINTYSDKEIRITVDDKNYTDKDDAIEIKNLNAGYHNIKVYQYKKGKKKSGNKYQLVYNGNIYLKQQYHTDVTINRFGKAFIDERVMDNNYYNEYDNDGDRNDDWRNNNNDWNNSNNRIMNSQSFEQFKQTLRNEGFENSRLNMAKSVIANNYFTTDQVKGIVVLFAYETYKLDIAKYTYDYTTDKNNYFTVANLLTYSSSKDELMKYIQNR